MRVYSSSNIDVAGDSGQGTSCHSPPARTRTALSVNTVSSKDSGAGSSSRANGRGEDVSSVLTPDAVYTSLSLVALAGDSSGRGDGRSMSISGGGVIVGGPEYGLLPLLLLSHVGVPYSLGYSTAAEVDRGGVAGHSMAAFTKCGGEIGSNAVCSLTMLLVAIFLRAFCRRFATRGAVLRYRVVERTPFRSASLERTQMYRLILSWEYRASLVKA